MEKPDRKFCPRGQKKPEASQGDASAKRTADGRFVPGFCPNPRGRPRKQATGVLDVLARVLGEQIPRELSGLSQQMTIEEGLVRSLCIKGFKEEGVALAILKLAASRSRSGSSDEQSQDDHESESNALSRYVEREMRRRALSDQTGDAADSLEEDGPAEDEQGA